jgi:hypothetical protein
MDKHLYTFFLVSLSGFELLASGLSWDKTHKEIKVETKETKVSEIFTFTNESNEIITFKSVTASCGCIIVDAPQSIGIGKSGNIMIKVPVPMRGRSYSKRVYVNTLESEKLEYTLSFKVTNMTKASVTRVPKSATAAEAPPKEKVVYTIPKPGFTPVLPKNSTESFYQRPLKMTKRDLLMERILATQVLNKRREYKPQSECPFLPLPIKPNFHFTFQGMKIYTCCERCLVDVKESPYHAIIKLSEKGQMPLHTKK